MDNFSSRLADAVQNSGLNRSEFAKRSGVGVAALGKWLSGKLMPKSAQLLSLAKTAGVSMEWLLTGHDPTPEELGLILAGNSLKDAGHDPTGGMFAQESEENLLKRIDLMPPEELQAQFAFFQATIQELRQRAEVFNEFATNLLIEAERLETMLQSMRNAHNALVRSGHLAAREFERRHGKDQGAESV